MKLENTNCVIWRTIFTPYREYHENGGAILFKNVVGKAEIWLNGQLIDTKDTVNEEDFKVEFPAVKDKCDLRGLFNSSTNTHVGLKGNVSVQGK